MDRGTVFSRLSGSQSAHLHVDPERQINKDVNEPFDFKRQSQLCFEQVTCDTRGPSRLMRQYLSLIQHYIVASGNQEVRLRA